MSENNYLSYDAWKEYLKADKETNAKWKSLIDLWERVKNDLKDNLEDLPKDEAIRRRRALTAKNIFNIINTAKEKPNFKWKRKMIRNEEDERHEYVIQCINPSSDYIFRKIKEERGVVSMFGDSIDKYLQPVADKIWALKSTLRVSITLDTPEPDLTFEALKTQDAPIKLEWAENHYAWNDRDVMNADGDIVPNPKYQHIPSQSDDVDEEWKQQEDAEETEPKAEENGQLIIPFNDEE